MKRVRVETPSTRCAVRHLPLLSTAQPCHRDFSDTRRLPVKSGVDCSFPLAGICRFVYVGHGMAHCRSGVHCSYCKLRTPLFPRHRDPLVWWIVSHPRRGAISVLESFSVSSWSAHQLARGNNGLPLRSQFLICAVHHFCPIYFWFWIAI